MPSFFAKSSRVPCATFLAGLFFLILVPAVVAQTPSISIPVRDWFGDHQGPIGLTGRPYASSAASTTFLASYGFDSGPSCVEDGWTSVDLTAGGDDFGDFAGLYPGVAVNQQDLCVFNYSCVWGFFEGSTYDYACGGVPSQAVVPWGNLLDGFIHNEIWSPPIALAGSGSNLKMSFSVYSDLDLHNLVFYTWRVRSIFSGTPGEWRGHQTIYYGPLAVQKGDWNRHTISFGDLIEPGADEIQVALGVVDMYGSWAPFLGGGVCHSHAPLFDDVSLIRVSDSGPRIHVEPIDLFQDNFAEDGTVTGTVRVDIARDINPRAVLDIRPGDSLVAWVGEPTFGVDYDATGVPASGPAVYLHVKDVSPAKSGTAITDDPARWPVVTAASGWTTLRFDSVRTAVGVVEGRYCVDLHDALYTPGDTIVFYLSARDANGVTAYWTEFTGVTFSQNDAVDAAMEMTCLPAAALGAGDILYVDDADGHGAQWTFDDAFGAMNMVSLVDRFDVRGPDYLAGNGLGSRVVDVMQQLVPHYSKIIWNSGYLPHGTIGGGSGQPEKSPDAQVLAEFLANNDDGMDGRGGGLFISGDCIASELAGMGGARGLRAFIDYAVVNQDHIAAGLGVVPLVQGTPASMFAHETDLDATYAYGGCPMINTFDVLAAQGTAKVEAQYLGNGLEFGAAISQRTLNDVGKEQGVLLFGFSFHYIRDDAPGPILDRWHVLDDILKWLNNEPGDPCAAPWVRARQVPGGVSVTWDFVPSCHTFDSFRVYRSVDSDTVLIAETDGETREYVDADAVGGKTNTYLVDGLRLGYGWVSLDSDNIFVTASISGFTAVARDLGIEISWKMSPAAGVTGFSIFRIKEGESEWLLLHDDPLGSSTRRYLDKTVVPGTTYQYHMDVIYAGVGALSGGDAEAKAKASLTLVQNFPNPFNPATTIGFTVPSPTYVNIVIFDVGGRRVATLVDDVIGPAGYHEAQWSGEAESGDRVASGVYFCRMSAAGQMFTKKLVIVR